MPAPLPVIQTNKIIDSLAAGNTHRDTAVMLGVCKDTVSRKAKQLKAIIEARALEYFEQMVPKATELNSACVAKAQDLYDTLTPAELSPHAPLLNQAHKISDRILQSVGIAPSLAPSVVVQQFVQVNNQVVLAPQLAGLFTPQALAEVSPSEEVMDAEWTELEADPEAE